MMFHGCCGTGVVRHASKLVDIIPRTRVIPARMREGRMLADGDALKDIPGGGVTPRVLQRPGQAAPVETITNPRHTEREYQSSSPLPIYSNDPASLQSLLKHMEPTVRDQAGSRVHLRGLRANISFVQANGCEKASLSSASMIRYQSHRFSSLSWAIVVHWRDLLNRRQRRRLSARDPRAE